MGLGDRLFRRRARRVTAPLREETARDEQRLAVGADEWARWWVERGERELRCILMTAWDPVGSGDAAAAWDEYDSYLAGVAHRLRDATDDDEGAHAVAAFVRHVESDLMGIHSSDRHRRAWFLAETLVAWHEWSFVRRGRPPHEWIDED